jgi:hypothetical protein
MVDVFPDTAVQNLQGCQPLTMPTGEEDEEKPEEPECPEPSRGDDPKDPEDRMQVSAPLTTLAELRQQLRAQLQA